MAVGRGSSGTMRIVPPRTLVVLNPRSSGGGGGRRWPQVEVRLRAALGDFEVERTYRPRDAERIAREGVRAGIEQVIVAGGDGTLSEVVNGLLAAKMGHDAEIGFLPLGSGTDLARTLGVASLDLALAALSSGVARPFDAVHVTFVDADGHESSRYFVNIASLGASGLVVDLADRGRRTLGGPLSFLLATLQALARYRSQPVALRLDGELVHDGRLVLAAAANGSYFGGGMHVAPQAVPDDGLLDVVVVKDVSRPQLWRKLPKVYRGTHLRDRSGRVVPRASARSRGRAGHGSIRSRRRIARNAPGADRDRAQRVVTDQARTVTHEHDRHRLPRPHQPGSRGRHLCGLGQTRHPRASTRAGRRARTA